MTKTEELQLELSKKGLKYVGTRGNCHAPVCLVGEAPGADEDQAGIPFVGGAGRELDRMLRDGRLDGSNCWWTNPYKTRPPDNKIDRLSELGVSKTLFEAQFFEELAQYKPTFICPLGATALGLLCEFTKSPRSPFHAQISKFQGSLLKSSRPEITWEHYVIPHMHPAYILRNWSDRVVVVLTLGKVAEELAFWQKNRFLQPLPSRKLIDSPPFHDAFDYLRMMLELPDDNPISTDIENIGVFKGKYKTPQRNRLPYVIGFAPSANEAISIGLSEYETEQSIKIWHLINQLLRRKRLLGQNFYTHDAPWMAYIGFDVSVSSLEDTLVRHHVLWPELSHKLEFQTIQYTREPYYKDEGKAWTVKEKAKLKRYNCKDCCVTREVFDAQELEFAAR